MQIHAVDRIEMVDGSYIRCSHLGLAQNDVLTFHREFDVVIGDFPAIRRAQLREDLLREELDETITAIRQNRLPEAVDGLCDLIYVALGTLVEFGVHVEQHWLAVQTANMAKIGGAVREDGKRLKPPGWTPPDHDTILRRVGWLPPHEAASLDR